MPNAMTVTFLGTSSGGGPSESRNCSSLVCNVLGDGSLWMVDCSEGTLRQFAFQPKGLYLKPNSVTKIFITHMHADHIMGIVPFLRNVLFPPSTTEASSHQSTKSPPKVEIYGPSGIRNFVRQVMKMTLTRTAETYTVHELLTQEDPLLPCLPSNDSAEHSRDPNVLHICEVAGKDIRCSKEDGFWRELTKSRTPFGDVLVDAGSILHRDPCIGYIIRENYTPHRKLVILGDTHDASAIIPLCLSPHPSLLIHESTEAHIPRHVDANSRRSVEVVLEKAFARGHSVPTMAGTFAKIVGAERLVLNHIGARFPAPRNGRDHRTVVMQEIETQATKAWGSRKSAIAAWDFMRVVIPPPQDPAALPNPNFSISATAVVEETTMNAIYQEAMTLQYADPTAGIYTNNRGHNNNYKKRRR